MSRDPGWYYRDRSFCETDLVRLERFNPDLVLERPELLSRGDARCLFRVGWRVPREASPPRR